MPAVMLAPIEFDTTARSPASAAAMSRVVVVLPLVALTITTSRPAVRSRNSCGFTTNAARPPMTLPEPRCTAFEEAATSRPTPTASRDRIGNDVLRDGIGEGTGEWRAEVTASPMLPVALDQHGGTYMLEQPDAGRFDQVIHGGETFVPTGPRVGNRTIVRIIGAERGVEAA